MTTIAPTGSINLIADSSPGIEPIYGVQETRCIMDGVTHTTLLPALHVADAPSVLILPRFSLTWRLIRRFNM